MRLKWFSGWRRPAPVAPPPARREPSLGRRAGLQANAASSLALNGGMGFDAAATDSLVSRWGTLGRTTDVYLKYALRPLQYRSADLARNEEYARRFLQLLRQNVIGPQGIQMQNRALKRRGEDRDKPANDRVNAAWLDWGKLGSPTADGRLSWLDCQNLFETSLARDGEVLVRMHGASSAARNPYGFAISFLSPAYLDPSYERILPNNHRIHLGIEMDEWRRPLAYWLRTANPDGERFPLSPYAFERVPADQILHAFVIEDSEQSRGIPWLTVAARRLRMLGAYEEAELTAARVGASKMGFYQREAGAGDPPATDKDEETGTFIQDMTPGGFEIVPDGYKLTEFKPDHPNNGFPSFVKSTLRGAASGLNVTYHSLGNDLEGVNFSSIRSGTLEERDGWRALQYFALEHFHAPVFERFLSFGLALKAPALAGLDFDEFERLCAPWWRPRGWAWVDPRNDADASGRRLAMGLTSRSKLAAEQGEDFEEILEERKHEKELAAAYGIELVDIVQPQKVAEIGDAGGDQVSNADAPAGAGQAQAKGAK